MDKNVIETVVKEVSADNPAVLATVIKTTGSVPRREGAKMLIFPHGRTVGTIGGGCGEAEVRREALAVLDEGKPKTYQVLLNSDLAAEEGMVCGGIMEVYLEPLQEIKIFAEALECLKSSQPAVLITALGEPGVKGLFSEDGRLIAGDPTLALAQDKIRQVLDKGRALLEVLAERRLLLEPVLPAEKLLILGAGHIAQAVASMGKKLDFHVIVVDDRPDFANRARFPEADEVICDDFANTIRRTTIDPNTYIVIVTRGHRYDEVCLREVLGRPAKYLGMIGSKRRVKLLLNKLQEAGFAAEDLAKVKSPIGLNIGAETPAEIAISILAEIIAVRRGHINLFN